MSDLIMKIIYYVYGRPFKTILLWTVLALIIWTIINALAHKKVRIVLNYLMVSMITVTILFFTITNRSIHVEREVRLMPFWSFINGSRQAARLNVFFFLPFGLSLPYLLPDKVKHKATMVILIAAIFSMVIETIQFVFRLGLCETDDVIMNTLGAAIGTISFLVVNQINRRTQKRFG